MNAIETALSSLNDGPRPVADFQPFLVATMRTHKFAVVFDKPVHGEKVEHLCITSFGSERIRSAIRRGRR